MSNRDAGGHLLFPLAWRRRGKIRPAASFFIKIIALRRSFLSKKIAPTHSLFYQINGANALIAILK
ncbi:hypothetical protein [Levyella massiliensis]|uniref:hypothetical protein n=1 Tax=Levyella massiliensis TaxID=938289 RepID=UPI0039999E38